MSPFAIFIQRGPASGVLIVCALSSLCAALALNPQRTTPLHHVDLPLSLASRDGDVANPQRARDQVAPPPAAAVSVPASPPEPAYRFASATVEHSFVSAVRRVGVNAAAAAMLMDAFSHQIDLRRDLRRGNRLKFVFAQPESDTTDAEALAFPLAARIEIGPRTHDVFLFRDGDGRPSYRANAQQLQALVPAMLRFPLEFLRVSSPFSSNRLNPVTRRWQAHDGVDLAAAIGTPVRATADGVVAFIGAQTGYGNVVKLRNAVPFSTTFAHLSRFASGLRAGDKVRRGDLIGYVGSTGRSTGPHLHYEVRVDGVPQDPLTVSLPSAAPIPTAAIENFQKETSRLEALL
jgi:murein DD-endopeptidase MepM/ murein hydrolase activator NlpD